MEDQQKDELKDAAAAPAAEPGAAGEDLAAKCAEYLAGWQRALADYANLKRDAERSAVELGKYASAGVVTALLPVLDSFAKAHAAYPADGDAAALAKWAEGIGHIKSQLDAALKALGVAVINAADVPFDPALHEAMMMEPPPESTSPGTVLRVLEPGYRMHDRVLRAAKVVVAE